MLGLYIILIGVAILIIGLVKKNSIKHNEVIDSNKDVISNKKKNIDAYKLYWDWCKKKNEKPITIEEFEQLANMQGGISMTDLMHKHNKNINPPKSKIVDNSTNDDSLNKYEEEIEERKKRDKKFIESAIIGYATNSTTKGALFGGSLLGGMFGDYLNKKKKK
ncbi:MAG: hypothetical protein KF781_03900 [Chitinophagaceae bacterium]|nr:hypothetical protein [Chitinophagaceae bacterium]MCW5904771.1 hypothetical protein [Chitinophagaceae bacterium]